MVGFAAKYFIFSIICFKNKQKESIACNQLNLLNLKKHSKKLYHDFNTVSVHSSGGYL